ncbi:hypothetical protein EUX53_15010 [Pseudomonas orientalis]|nr:hypothetical protein EUX53_15010 [Pseudomonas orientalis]
MTFGKPNVTPADGRSELAREKRKSAAVILDKRGALGFFASKLAPTVSGGGQAASILLRFCSTRDR